jgi:hypothetical protein
MGKKQYNVRLEETTGKVIEEVANRREISESEAHRLLLRKGIEYEANIEEIHDRLDEIEEQVGSAPWWRWW